MEDETLFHYLRREVTPSEAARIAEWCEADPTNRQRLDQLSRLIAAADRRSQRFTTGRPPGAREIVRLADATLTDTSVGRRHDRSRPQTFTWIVMATAAVAATVVLASQALLDRGRDATDLRAEEFRTGPTEMTTVQLDDGTVVRLAPETTLRLERGVAVPSVRERRVWLDGRAFFAIAHVPARPFVVATPAGVARVIGTRFDISANRDSLSLVVVEGRVALSGRDGREIEVSAKEMARVAEGRTTPRVRVEDPAAIVNWTGEFLVFQSDPLREAAAEIERRYGVGIVIDDAALAGETISAWFVDRDVEEVVRVICLIVRATCSIEDDVVRISR